MAEFYLADDPSTQKLWGRKVWRGYRRGDAFWDEKNGLVGTDETRHPIVMLDDFEKGPGDELTQTFIHQIGGRGVVGDEQLEGKETTIDSVTFKMKVDSLAHAVRTRGRMNGQRVHFKPMEEAENMLREWAKKRRSVGMINHLCGNSRQTDLAYTWNNTVSEPDSEHIYRINQGLGSSNDQTVGADNTAKLTIGLIDTLLDYAESSTPPLLPFYIDGNPYYGMIIHPWSASDLRASTDYKDIQTAALQGGLITKNPIFTRANGVYRNVIILTDHHVPQGKHSGTGAAVANTRRNVFFGAGAVAMGYGRPVPGEDGDHMKWTKATWDFGRKFGAAVELCAGMKSINFKDPTGTVRDLGRIVVTTYTQDRRAYVLPTGPQTYVTTYDEGQPQ